MGSEFERILKREPLLGDYGFCQWEGGDIRTVGRGLSMSARRALSVVDITHDQEFQQNRESLATSEADFWRATAWIGVNLEKSRKINQRRSAYGLKHIFEYETGVYVTNGLFIAAMLHCGFSMERSGPNALFNVREFSVKRFYRRGGLGW